MSTTPPVRTAVVVGNPKPASRTLVAAEHVVRGLTGREPDLVVDLATVGAPLLDWADDGVARLHQQVREADLVVVASPTYKATYSGLLKLFLDRFNRYADAGLTGIAVPLMLGALPGHALAAEVSLRPLLTEIGGITPVPGLFVLESEHDDPAAYAAWLETARPTVSGLLSARSTRSSRTEIGVPA